MFDLPSLYEIVLLVPAIVIGLTFHEFAHAWVANRLGDPTPRYAGRLTLNPAAHVDPVGLIMLFLVHFGWAKPVPVNPYNLSGGPRKGMLMVALAGPLTNLAVALAASLLLRLGVVQVIPYGYPIFAQIILINVILAFFNLIPIPPLDGSKILAGLWPGRNEWLHLLETYGVIVLLFLLFTGIIGKVLGYVIYPVYHALMV